jgi:2-polyprenyl-3-methyl-5-hydroxy-6-metoxy-1,4-benzoquinol methylase
MTTNDRKAANEETRQVWDRNAAYWDERMGEGNDFVEVLIWPATERLLTVQPGERILDAACGNGLTSRRLAAMGAEVTAFDFSAEMIELARRRTAQNQDRIHYHVLDATDEQALLSLGEHSFDAALCNMALFDMAEIEPLFRALARLLRPGGRFVFSVIHPCFNNPHSGHDAEEIDLEGEIMVQYSIRVWGYMTPTITHGVAMRGQPQAQLYFHRPLQALLGAGFEAGFVLDGLEERSFPPEATSNKNPLAWSGYYSEIPPVLVVRMRVAG